MHIFSYLSVFRFILSQVPPIHTSFVYFRKNVTDHSAQNIRRRLSIILFSLFICIFGCVRVFVPVRRTRSGGFGRAQTSKGTIIANDECRTANSKELRMNESNLNTTAALFISAE